MVDHGRPWSTMLEKEDQIYYHGGPWLTMVDHGQKNPEHAHSNSMTSLPV